MMQYAEWIRGVGVAVVLALAAGLAGAVLAQAERRADLRFEDVRRQTEEFIQYHREIELSPEQQQVFEAALDELPAPCCSDRSATTCCCSCNMARSWWGLAKHLIAEEGYGADDVRSAVARWIEFIHPEGYAGDACYRARCGKPFHQDGCGGMMDGAVVY